MHKNMKKRTIALILTVTMLFSMAVTAIAEMAEEEIPSADAVVTVPAEDISDSPADVPSAEPSPEAPSLDAPVVDTPVAEDAVGGEPAEENIPVGDVPADAPIDENVPAEDVPTDDIPAENVPASDTPAEDASVEEADAEPVMPVCTCGTETEEHEADCAILLDPELFAGLLGGVMTFDAPTPVSVDIINTITTDGKITANVTPDALDYTYEWYKSTDDGVSFLKVDYNDTDRPNTGVNWLNVVYDNEVQKPDGTYELQAVKGIQYKVIVKDNNHTNIGESTFKIDHLNIAIQNGGFEEPRITESNAEESSYSSYKIFKNEDLPSWTTTATDEYVEVANVALKPGNIYYNYGIGTLKDGFTDEQVTGDFPSENVYAEDDAEVGIETNQFAEINANEAATLYQSVLTSPGAKLNWQIAHRARYYVSGMNAHLRPNNITIPERTETLDTLYIVIMSDEGATDVLANGTGATQQEKMIHMIRTVLKDGDGSYTSMGRENATGDYTVTGSGKTYPVYIERITSDATGWHAYQGEYTVPEDQYYTRFFFVAGQVHVDFIYDNSTKPRYGTGGNLIDTVHFSSAPPVPILNSHNLTINYLHKDTNAVLYSTYSQNLQNGKPYSVPSPAIPYYSLVDVTQETVSGVMGANDIEVNVYYTPDEYTLHYYIDGDILGYANAWRSETFTIETLPQIIDSYDSTGKFYGWYADAAYQIPVSSDLTAEALIAMDTDGDRCINIYGYLTFTLTVKKTGGAAGEPYVFEIHRNGAAYTEASIIGNDSITIHELRRGTYSIVENEKWSWRYAGDNGTAVNLSPDNPDGSITCTNTQEKTKWLNGFSEVVKNIFGVPMTGGNAS